MIHSLFAADILSNAFERMQDRSMGRRIASHRRASRRKAERQGAPSPAPVRPAPATTVSWRHVLADERPATA